MSKSVYLNTKNPQRPFHYWSDLANLTHATQVAEFGFCTCEEQEQFPYDDCPREIPA